MNEFARLTREINREIRLSIVSRYRLRQLMQFTGRLSALCSQRSRLDPIRARHIEYQRLRTRDAKLRGNHGDSE